MGKVLGGVLLVSGTTIGAGMLALPVATGLGGFYPSLALLFTYWLFLTFTAFLMLEVALWLPPHANLITMARQTLGRWGEFLSWFVYLYLLYALLTAYLAGGGAILLDLIDTVSQYILPLWAGPLLVMGIFSLFVYKGHGPVDRINRILMGCLVIAYLIIVGVLAPHVEGALIKRSNWSAILLGSSVVATSFGFHIIIPSLVVYLDRNVASLRWAILIGSLIPLLVYIVWELIALGILPLGGKDGLISGYETGANGATLLADYLNRPSVSWIARFFSLFAIVTSFLGVSLSLNDFLADGFKIKKTRPGRILLYAMTFFPPLVIALSDPRAFLSALEYAGAFGVVLLLGLLPALMVWRGRYHLAFPSTFRVPGGKIGLLLAMVFSVTAIGIEVFLKVKG
ncbi:MAG: tyrosine transporter [Parachlamydia sp.]|nr:tyrosine transporter [Parachlamydia sp.]